MKKLLLLLILFNVALSMNAQVSKTVNLNTAGTLSTFLSDDELKTINNLTLSGNIDARDFKTIRDRMPMLNILDLSGVIIMKYDGLGGTSQWIPNYAANSIPDYAFAKYATPYTYLTSIILPSNIKSIGFNSFMGCNGLTDIVIPPNITVIKDNAFSSCVSLKSISIPPSVTSIGNRVFEDCKALKSMYVQWSTPININLNSDIFMYFDRTACTLYVPYGTASLYSSANAWKEFTNIVPLDGFLLSATTINIESEANTNSAINIDSYVTWTAQSDQPWLLVSPASGTGISQKLRFSAEANPLYIPRIAKVTISAPGINSQTITVTQSALLKVLAVKAGGLSTALTADELNSISRLALTGTIDVRDFKTMCFNMPLLANLDLSGVNIASYTGTDGYFPFLKVYSENEIPEAAFSANLEQSKLTSIVFPSTTTSIGKSAFLQCYELTSINVPSSVKSIGDYAFRNCNKLASATISEGVASIGERAFNYCTSLVSVSIPSTISSIGNYAFQYCTALTSIKCAATIAPKLDLNVGVFANVSKTNCVLYVPNNSNIFYSTQTYWKDFSNIVEMPKFVLSASTINIGAQPGGSSSVIIDSYVAWTAQSNESWLTVSPASGKGPGQKLSFTVEENLSNTTRTATITIYPAGLEAQTITVTQSPVTGVDQLPGNQQLAIFPNPTTGKVKLVFDKNPQNGTNLTVVDITGRTIIRQLVQTREEKIDLTGRPSGVYFLKTNLKDGKVQRIILR